VAWLTQWWTFVATMLVVFAPGMVAARAIGLRRLGAWAFAPVGSVAMISLVATVYAFAGIHWSLLSAALGLAATAALMVAARLVLRLPVSRPRVVGARWPVVLSLVVAASLLTVRITAYIGDPMNISQTNDASFHLGAVRAIIEHGRASSFGLAGLIDPAAVGGFYPGAWHATDSLVALLSGGIDSIAVATNALTLVVAVVVWPLGVAWLTQVATGRRLATAAAAAMSAGLVIFPLEMIQYGVLYAYFLAAALLPAAIGAVVVLTKRWHRSGGVPERVAAAVLAATMAIAAIGNAQPSVLLAWGLALWLYAAGGTFGMWRRHERGRLWALAGTFVALALLSATWWKMGRMVTAGVWSAVRRGPEALVEILSAGFVKSPPSWWIAALLFVGLAAMIRRGGARWLAAGWFAFAFLAFVAYAVRNETARVLLVGPWYSDPYRLAALVPTVMIPVAAFGVVWLVDLAALWLRRRRVRGSRAASHSVVRARVGAVAIGVLLAIGICVVSAQPVVLRYKLMDGFAESEPPFVVNENAWLDPDERALLARLADEVPDGATVLGNPHTGAALAYFLTGVDVFPAKWQVPRNGAYSLLKKQLPHAAADPAVCDAVRELGASYVLDFGEGDVGPGTVQKMPGFTGFEGVDGFELVDQEGDAKLWRITACG